MILDLALIALLMAGRGPGSAAWAGTLEGMVADQSGRPLEDALVFAVPLSRRGAPASRPPVPAVMDQRDRTFVPFVLGVELGAAVSFPNSDNIRHHVYSFSPTKIFDLPLYAGLPATSIVFDKLGVVALGCNIHDWMLGYIYVVKTPYFGRTDASGKTQLRDLHADTYEVRVWHPRMLDTVDSTSRRVTVATGHTEPPAFRIAVKPERAPRRPPNPGG